MNTSLDIEWSNATFPNSFCAQFNTSPAFQLIKPSSVSCTSDVSEIDDGCVNYNAGDLLNWAQKKYKNVALDHTVSEDLFTIIIYKNEK